MGVQPRGPADRREPLSLEGTDEEAAASPDAEEADRLRERLRALDAERAEEVARASHAVAELERRTYWLDRWELDLDDFARTAAGRLVDRAFAARRRLRYIRERRAARR